jgi:KaiC/GvpD/RAD55 family RecA-like ATPase
MQQAMTDVLLVPAVQQPVQQQQLTLATARELDRATRAAFVDIPYTVGAVHLLSGGAGSGKSSCSIRLAQTLVQKHRAQDTEHRVLMVTYTRCEQAEEAARTTADIDISEWKTVDSLVWTLHSSDLEDQEAVELHDAASVRLMAERVLERSFTVEEIAMRQQLCL